MTNYLAVLGAMLSLFAAGLPRSQDAKAAPVKPATAAPATASPAAAAAPAPTATALPRYVQNAARQQPHSSRSSRPGAATKGSFRQFTTELVYDEKNLAASSLDVTVQIASVDTQDQERDDMLAGADLFDAQKFPTATFTAASLAKRRRRESRGGRQAHAPRRDARSAPAAHSQTDARRASSSPARPRSSASTTASARATGNRPIPWATT